MIHKGVTLAYGCFVHPWRKAHKVRPLTHGCRICIWAWNVNHPKEQIKYERRIGT
jgi:predicted 2-oxoglutarate/Fe(II)-dependent dioxygenase YbiX